MPIYQYACLKTKEIFEQIRPLSDFNRQVVTCSIHCGGENYHYPLHDAEKIWSISVTHFEAKPTIIFRNSKNPTQVEVATYENDSPPLGFIKEELRGPIQRSNFEREQNKILDVKNQMVTESIRLRKSAERKARHEDQNSRMSNYDIGTQELIKFARERNRKKEPPQKKSQVRLDVNHLDSSNLIK